MTEPLQIIYHQKVRCILLIILVLFIRVHIHAQNESSVIQHRVFLLANTADLPIKTNFYASLNTLLSKSSSPFSVIVNGDLVSNSKDGSISTPDSFRVDQLLIATQGFPEGKTIIIPGDRDWANSGTAGWRTVRNLERLIVNRRHPHVTWAIGDGCPGPQIIELDGGLRLLSFQTQWWNHPYEKPHAADANCQLGSTDAFLEGLEEHILESQGKNILIAGHFPITSLGEYGGHFGLAKQFFPLRDFHPQLYVPLPILGNLYTAFRQNVGTKEDIVNSRFEELREGMDKLIRDNHSLVYLSGHEYNMQILKLGDNYHINSGAIGKSRYVANAHEPNFSLNQQGIVELVYEEHGDIMANVYTYDEDRGFELKNNRFLFQSVCHVGDSITPFNTAHLLCGDNPDYVDASDMYDSIVNQAASEEYVAGKLQKIFWGKHYRSAWTNKINIPYANLDTLKGGLAAITSNQDEGTLGIRFRGKDNKEYMFRSINKNPLKQLSFEWRNSIIGYIMKDQTSTQHPYGAMITHPLMEQLNIQHFSPSLYLMPDDDKLGLLRKDFGNMMGFLEENPASNAEIYSSFAPPDQSSNVIRTYKFLSYRYEFPQLKIDAEAYARARIFDIWVGDWDRREENWKWDLRSMDDGEGTLAVPIANDRDQAFSKWDGFFPWLADREWMRPDVQHFGEKIKGMRSLTWRARHLDRLLGANISKQEWLIAARNIQKIVSDSLIEVAVRKLPPEIYALDGEEIESKLKSRRDQLLEASEDFYDLLAKEVDIVGTNQSETFYVERISTGAVKVEVFHKRLVGVGQYDSTLYYRRIFFPRETKEIRLFGLDGRDKFLVYGKAQQSIKLRIIGGPGRDNIIDNSYVSGQSKHTVIYEQGERDRSRIKEGEEAWRIRTAQQYAYNYERTAFKYNRYYPFPSLSFNSEDGLMPTLGIRFISNTYGKSAFGSSHSLRFTYATSKSYLLRYEGIFNEVFGRWGIMLRGELAKPNNYLNFFGLGNETVKDDSLFRANYYRTRYQSISASAGIFREFWKRSNIQLRVHYENNEAQIPDFSILFGEKDFLGIDRTNLLLLQTHIDLDFRNNPYFPEKGMRLFAGHTNGFVINNQYSNYGQTQLFLEYYTNIFRTHLPITLAMKGGVEDSYGAIPFYKQFNLGHRSNLRGYRRNRFTGTGTIYGNSELRVEIAHDHTAKIPYRLGLKGFFDIGKVIHDGESSKIWHRSFGWGFYFIPFSERVALNFSMSFSEEERMLLSVSLGRVFR